jgi:glycosyltransferase involved in cell wall biosynthesis
MEPTFSIVVPVFNGQNYLLAALESITNQSYQNFECLVIDDGSVDKMEVPRIASSLRDPRIRVLQKANGGTGSALNLGLINARGKYFSWLSHDDLWSKDKLALTIPHLDDETLLCTNYALIDQRGKMFFESSFEKSLDVTSSVVLLSRFLIHGSSVTFPVKFTEKIGLFDESLAYTQDYDYWIRVLIGGMNIKFLTSASTVGRIHDQQNSKLGQNKSEVDQILKRIIDIWCEKMFSYKVDRAALDLEVSLFRKFLNENSYTYGLKLLDQRIDTLGGEPNISASSVYSRVIGRNLTKWRKSNSKQK